VVDAARSERAPVPENGFWWAAADEEESWLAGSGVSLELQGDRLAAGLLSFNETGDSAWSFGSGALAGRVAHVPLVQLSRGDSPFHASGNRPVAGPGARLEIALDGPTHAQAWLVRSAGTDAIEVRALELVRSPFRSSPPGSAWAGRWVLVRDGERSAQVLDLRGFSLVDAETFRLVDAASGTALGCRLSAATTTQQADFCTLATDTVDIASFDQVGIDRLSGQGEDGARVQLLRVR
jgi:hypothetical protein